jgi:Putative DNA-binding domain
MSGAEARRQRALLAAIATRGPAPAELGLREDAARARQGLDAYRINAAAIAERALAAVFPTIQALIGAEDFEPLAREFWRAEPPVRGDLGEWGGTFAAWLEAHAAFTAWPYFGDAARLDLAVHRCERAADAEFDAASLALLSQAEPQELTLVLMPGTTLIASRWPIVTVHAAHHAADPDFAAMRAAIDSELAETALVARQGWRASVHCVDAATARWTAHLLAGAPLDQALSDAGESFDFAAWLATAVQQKCLKGAALRTDQSPTRNDGAPA